MGGGGGGCWTMCKIEVGPTFCHGVGQGTDDNAFEPQRGQIML